MVDLWELNTEADKREYERLQKAQRAKNNIQNNHQKAKKNPLKVIWDMAFGGKLEIVAYNRKRSIPSDILVATTKSYKSFNSRMSTVHRIKSALAHPDLNMIGLYGMPGIGKTMLVKEIARQAEKDNIFDEVVFANVSQAPDVGKIQRDIAERLGLEFRERTETGRARKLQQVISREKKILVILDDIWGYIDLETIGIPSTEYHKGCKVLLTTRNRNVLRSMACQIMFTIGVLCEEEAWSLFKKIRGEHIETSDLKSVGKYIVKECGGLPIVIVTIARALPDENMSVWDYVLQKLKSFARTSSAGARESVYPELCRVLKDEELKLIFLLCSLMDDHASISDLLNYSMGLGLLKGIQNIEEARKRLYVLVRKLKAYHLLLDSRSNELFSMHDIVRYVALSIAFTDLHVFTVRDQLVSTKWPDTDKLKSLTAISLHKCDIRELPEGLKCPQLRFFNIFSQGSSVKIPDNFFTGMTKLEVLAFTRMRLLSLPSSICLLVNLRTLCLDNCELGDIANIGGLKKLEILSFYGSDIGQLPKEIGQLSLLRLLNLRNCYKLKVIPPKIISSLSRLEELCVGCSACSPESFNVQTIHGR